VYSEHFGIADLFNRLRVDIVSGVVDILFRLNEVGKRGVDNIGSRWVVAGAVRDDCTRLVEQSFSLVGQSKSRTVRH
jgi:hypothetical protein